MSVFSGHNCIPLNLKLPLIMLYVLLMYISGCDKKTKNIDMACLEDISESPIMSIYVLRSGMKDFDKDLCRVIVAVWKDGQIIWSKDTLEGGPPYYESKIEPQKLQTFLKLLDQNRVFHSSQSYIAHVGPDMDLTAIVICDGTNRLWLSSSHEQFEENPNLVATNTGISSLNQFGGLSRQEILDKQPDDYKEFRRIWNIVREEAKKLMPEDGQHIEDAKFEIRRL